MRKSILVLAFALAGVLPAQSAEEANFNLATAGDLAVLCGAPEDPAAIHMCQGFLVGVHRTQQAMAVAMDTKFYCIPADGSVTRDSAAADFSGWVGATADVASMTPQEALIMWAKTSYPCK